MYSSEVCATDLDCPGNMLCVSNTTWWFAELPQPMSRDACACYPMYAWVRDSHTTCGPDYLAPATIFWATTSTLILFVYAILGGAAIRDFIYLFRISKPPLWTSAVGLGQLVVADALRISAQIVTLSMLFNPSGGISATTMSQSGYKQFHGANAKFSLFILASLMLCSSSLTVVTQWIDISARTVRLSQRPNYKLRYVGLALELVLLITIVALMMTHYLFGAWITSYSFTFVVFVLYIVGVVRMLRILRANPRYAETLSGIKRHAVLVGVSFFLCFLLFLIQLGVRYSDGYTTVSAQRESQRPGSIRSHQVFNFLVDLILIVPTLELHRFLHNMAMRKVKGVQVESVRKLIYGASGTSMRSEGRGSKSWTNSPELAASPETLRSKQSLPEDLSLPSSSPFQRRVSFEDRRSSSSRSNFHSPRPVALTLAMRTAQNAPRMASSFSQTEGSQASFSIHDAVNTQPSPEVTVSILRHNTWGSTSSSSSTNLLNNNNNYGAPPPSQIGGGGAFAELSVVREEDEAMSSLERQHPTSDPKTASPLILTRVAAEAVASTMGEDEKGDLALV